MKISVFYQSKNIIIEDLYFMMTKFGSYNGTVPAVSKPFPDQMATHI